MRRRPAGIWIVVGLQVALAVTLLPFVAESYPGVSPIAGMKLEDVWHDIYLGWAVINILAALWLWTLSRRGWVLVMVLVGVGLLANLYLWWLGQPAWIRMAILAATAFYLNSAPVRQLFERHRVAQAIVLRDAEERPV